MDISDLKVSQRKTTGKGPARVLRGQGEIPAVLYGPKTETILLSFSAYDLDKIQRQSASEHVIFNLIIGNGDTRNRTAMIREIQTEPVSNQVLHVDFFEISMDEKIQVKVQVILTGASKGVDRGGVLQVVRHELEISCLPADIPERIEIDVSNLDIGDTLRVAEVKVPEGVSLVFDANFTVAMVAAPAVAAEELAEEALEEEAEAAGGEEAGEA